MQTSYLGEIAEDFAVNLLQNKGYKILDRNFYSKFGEIDIIACEGSTLVFVEVKARWSDKYGSPEEAVTRQKLYKIKKTADYYLLTHPNSLQRMRIDVVALEIRDRSVTSARIINVD